jgi:hypothetical protein
MAGSSFSGLLTRVEIGHMIISRLITRPRLRELLAVFESARPL